MAATAHRPHRTALEAGRAQRPQVTGWLTRRPDRLTDEDRVGRDALLARNPALAATGRLVRDFVEIMVDRRGDDLNAWIGRARREGSSALRSFAAGLVRDLDAFTAGLTLPHSTGTARGHVNRIKMLTRQMCGRANFDLL
ncbi:transposase, partial [Rhodococcus sp. T7]|uniref:transposase n=1 Tax=Rhodococcus sp. T7 TaxID=627444 RepID=UPI00191798F9